MDGLKPKEKILKLLKEKSVVKQDVFHLTIDVFGEFKKVIKSVAKDLSRDLSKIDDRVVIEYTDKSEFEVELRVAGDILLFYMHTNVFDFDKSHGIWKTSYVRENEMNSYCGMINVYNFLNDSFKYDRLNDLGYLIARVFVNREHHYFVEGKRQLGFLYNDFVNSTLDKTHIKNIVESAILYSLDFDLFVPQFDDVKEVSVHEIKMALNSMQLKTAKRLGFRFMADNDDLS